MTAFRRVFAFAILIGTAAAFVTADRAADVRHIHLTKSEPAAESTVASAPQTIHLWFSEAPEVKVTTVQLTVAGRTHRIEKVAADAEDGKHIIATIDSIRGTGAYSVSWRTMSRDGHVVSGEIPFTVSTTN